MPAMPPRHYDDMPLSTATIHACRLPDSSRLPRHGLRYATSPRFHADIFAAACLLIFASAARMLYADITMPPKMPLPRSATPR